MMKKLENTCVRITVLAVVGIAVLSTGVGCRELAIRVAALGGTPSSPWASPQYVSDQAGFDGPSSGTPSGGNAGSTAQGANGATTSGGCTPYPYTSPPTCSGPSCPAEPVTPSWAGTSMGW